MGEYRHHGERGARSYLDLAVRTLVTYTLHLLTEGRRRASTGIALPSGRGRRRIASQATLRDIGQAGAYMKVRTHRSQELSAG